MQLVVRIGALFIIFGLLGFLQYAHGIHCFVCEDPKDHKCSKQAPFNCSTKNPSISMCSTSGKKNDDGKLIKTWKGCGGDGAKKTECVKKTKGVTECVCSLDLCNGFTPEIEGTHKISLVTMIAVVFIVGIPLGVGLVVRSRARLSRKLQATPMHVISQS